MKDDALISVCHNSYGEVCNIHGAGQDCGDSTCGEFCKTGYADFAAKGSTLSLVKMELQKTVLELEYSANVIIA